MNELKNLLRNRQWPMCCILQKMKEDCDSTLTHRSIYGRVTLIFLVLHSTEFALYYTLQRQQSF